MILLLLLVTAIQDCFVVWRPSELMNLARLTLIAIAIIISIERVEQHELVAN